MTIYVASFALNRLLIGTTPGTAETIYTATGEAQIGQITAYNGDTVPQTVYAYILTSGQQADSVSPVSVALVDAGESISITDMIAHVVPASGTIGAYADSPSVIRMTVSGLEYS
jgi:hypothetical protein